MFCIAAFIVLLFMAAVSAKYRRYLSKAWHCTFRRVTFRPCDISFKDEVKGRLLARVAVRKPKMVKAASIGLEIAAFLVIVLTVWSLYVVVKSGLNLYVYGTCNPSNAASCSLGAEACSIEEVKPSFIDSAKSFKLRRYLPALATGRLPIISRSMQATVSRMMPAGRLLSRSSIRVVSIVSSSTAISSRQLSTIATT